MCDKLQFNANAIIKNENALVRAVPPWFLGNYNYRGINSTYSMAITR